MFAYSSKTHQLVKIIIVHHFPLPDTDRIGTPLSDVGAVFALFVPSACGMELRTLIKKIRVRMNYSQNACQTRINSAGVNMSIAVSKSTSMMLHIIKYHRGRAVRLSNAHNAREVLN